MFGPQASESCHRVRGDRRRGLAVATTLALVAFGVGLAPGAVLTASAAEPAVAVVAVVPNANLADGDVVSVTVTGLQPSTDVRIIQCDDYGEGQVATDCSGPISSNVTGTDGSLKVPVTLQDVLFSSHEQGREILCRADECRIFVVWDDESGTPHQAQSETLEFIGAPATVSVRPAAGLRSFQFVRVTGMAAGASGQRVSVWEEACPTIRGYEECYGALPSVSTKVRKDGTYSLTFLAQRELAGGQDCMASGYWFGRCQVRVRVLDPQGRSDRSFGTAGSYLTFKVEPPANDTPTRAFHLGRHAIPVRTVGAAPQPEARCVPAPGQPVTEATAAYTTWYLFLGTGREMTLSTAGSIDGAGQPLTTLLGVYQAGSMAPVACVSLDSGGGESLTIPTKPWVHYLVQVGGRWEGDPTALADGAEAWWAYGKVLVTRR